MVIPSFVCPIGRTGALLPAGPKPCCASKIGRVDHDNVAFFPVGRQAIYHLNEYVCFALPLSDNVVGLVAGASRQPKPFKLIKMIPLNTRRSFTLGLLWLIGK